MVLIPSKRSRCGLLLLFFHCRALMHDLPAMHDGIKRESAFSHVKRMFSQPMIHRRRVGANFPCFLLRLIPAFLKKTQTTYFQFFLTFF